MSEQGNIRTLVKEAELYQTQGLMEESKKIYVKLLQFVGKSQQYHNHEKLIDAIRDRIRDVEKDLNETNQPTELPVLSQDVQDLIMKQFSFSQTKEAAAIEGAVALAGFGQHEQALAEFQSLLKQGILPVVAAKNILRCHLSLSSPERAIAQYKQWVSGNLLSKPDVKYIGAFLENLLKKRGLINNLPKLVETVPEVSKTTEIKDSDFEISSVIIRLDSNGISIGNKVEFDVAFQANNVISFVVFIDQKALLDAFRVGIRLRDIQFFSPMAVFRGSGIVSGKTKIKVGPRRGDYVIDIKIDDV